MYDRVLAHSGTARSPRIPGTCPFLFRSIVKRHAMTGSRLDRYAETRPAPGPQRGRVGPGLPVTGQPPSIGFLQLFSMLIICTGQRSAASWAQPSRSGSGMPCAISPLSRNFSITWLNESSGFCSKNPGHASQQEPQLTQVERSILTFMCIRLFLIGLNGGRTRFFAPCHPYFRFRSNRALSGTFPSPKNLCHEFSRAPKTPATAKPGAAISRVLVCRQIVARWSLSTLRHFRHIVPGFRDLVREKCTKKIPENAGNVTQVTQKSHKPD